MRLLCFPIFHCIPSKEKLAAGAGKLTKFLLNSYFTCRMPRHNPNFSVRSPATMIIDWPSLSGIFVTGSDVDVYLVQELHNSKSWIWRCFVLARSGILFVFLWGGGQGKGRLGERGMEKGEMGREKGERGERREGEGERRKGGRRREKGSPCPPPLLSLFNHSFLFIYL